MLFESLGKRYPVPLGIQDVEIPEPPGAAHRFALDVGALRRELGVELVSIMGMVLSSRPRIARISRISSRQ